MSNLLIRQIPRETIVLAKKMAASNHHSLQEEISQLLIKTVRFYAGAWSTRAENIYKHLAKPGKRYSDTVKLLHEDRAR